MYGGKFLVWGGKVLVRGGGIIFHVGGRKHPNFNLCGGDSHQIRKFIKVAHLTPYDRTSRTRNCVVVAGTR